MTLVGFKKLFSKVRPDLIEELPARVEHLKTARLVIDYSDERDTCTFRFEADEPAYYERFGENIYLERAVLDRHITGLKITDYTVRGQAALEEILSAMLDSLFSAPHPNSSVDALTLSLSGTLRPATSADAGGLRFFLPRTSEYQTPLIPAARLGTEVIECFSPGEVEIRNHNEAQNNARTGNIPLVPA